MRIAFTVSRAITRDPIAAWIATSNIWRGISSCSRSTSAFAARVRAVAVDDERERVDGLAVDQDVEPDELASRKPARS